MRLIVNGDERDSDAHNLAELWRRETEDLDVAGPQGFAMAVNGVVVRQADWPAMRLADGDRIEMIRAMQGG